MGADYCQNFTEIRALKVFIRVLLNFSRISALTPQNSADLSWEVYEKFIEARIKSWLVHDIWWWSSGVSAIVAPRGRCARWAPGCFPSTWPTSFWPQRGLTQSWRFPSLSRTILRTSKYICFDKSYTTLYVTTSTEKFFRSQCVSGIKILWNLEFVRT